MIERAVSRSTSWAVQKIGFQTLIPVGILIFIFLGSVAGLQNVLAGLDQAPLIAASLLALLLAWVCAKSKMRGSIAIAIVAFSGMLFVLLSVAKLWGRLFLLLPRQLRIWVAISTISRI